MTERSNTQPTERLRRYWDKHSSSYDREMAFFERVLFEDGRAWVCSQITGDVLEVAIGTGRNLPFYPPDVHLTGVEFSPSMLDLARQRAQTLGRQVDIDWVTRRHWICPMPHSTRLFAPCRCAAFPTNGAPSPR